MDEVFPSILLLFASAIAAVALLKLFFGAPAPVDCELRPDGVFLPRIGWTIPWHDIDKVTINSDWHITDMPFLMPWPGKLFVALQVRNGFVIRLAYWPRWFAAVVLDVYSRRAGEVRVRPTTGDRDITPLAEQIEAAVAHARTSGP